MNTYLSMKDKIDISKNTTSKDNYHISTIVVGIYQVVFWAVMLNNK